MNLESEEGEGGGEERQTDGKTDNQKDGTLIDRRSIRQPDRNRFFSNPCSYEKERKKRIDRQTHRWADRKSPTDGQIDNQTARKTPSVSNQSSFNTKGKKDKDRRKERKKDKDRRKDRQTD